MVVNNQPRSKQNLRTTPPYDIAEIVYSTQGEGPFSGRPTTVIRLAGCPLQCSWCDTDYSKKIELGVPEIASVCKGNLIVITGGEPFRQDIVPLIRHLHALKYEIQVETSGCLMIPEFPWSMCTVVCSPKTVINKTILKHCRHWKFVVDRNTNFVKIGPTQVGRRHEQRIPESLLDRVRNHSKNKDHIYLIPLADDNEKENIDRAVELCSQYDFTLILGVR